MKHVPADARSRALCPNFEIVRLHSKLHPHHPINSYRPGATGPSLSPTFVLYQVLISTIAGLRGVESRGPKRPLPPRVISPVYPH